MGNDSAEVSLSASTIAHRSPRLPNPVRSGAARVGDTPLGRRESAHP